MPRKKKPPELTFQQHIADFLVCEHGYGVLEQSDITDTEHAIAEDHLWAFLEATQADTLKKLSDDYDTDARDEVFKALRKELAHTPLWMLLRHGLRVRGLEFRLFYPKPRSAASAVGDKSLRNRITFRPHFYFGAVESGQAQKEMDFVFFLNGLPIVALEVKHEANQNVHDAVAQFVARDPAHRIFSHPFLFLAADTSDVMAATDPRREENFRWHNMGLVNTPTNPGEYPVEFLYREMLSKDQLLEALSFFLVHVPKRGAEGDKPERKPIIVTTQQKFAWIHDQIQKSPELKNLRVAFLIDEAHRSQEGRMGAAIRLPFRKADEPDADAPEQDPEEQLAKVIREHDANQLFIAFTATPSPATLDLFGEPFDSYTEAEAIQEGYIVDVATSIISYKTLYNRHCHFVLPPDEEEKVYPKYTDAGGIFDIMAVTVIQTHLAFAA